MVDSIKYTWLTWIGLTLQQTKPLFPSNFFHSRQELQCLQHWRYCPYYMHSTSQIEHFFKKIQLKSRISDTFMVHQKWMQRTKYSQHGVEPRPYSYQLQHSNSNWAIPIVETAAASIHYWLSHFSAKAFSQDLQSREEKRELKFGLPLGLFIRLHKSNLNLSEVKIGLQPIFL